MGQHDLQLRSLSHGEAEFRANVLSRVEELEKVMTDTQNQVVKITNGQRRLSDSMNTFGQTLATNNAMTQEIFTIISSVRGFATVMRWIGTGLWFLGKWLVMPVLFLGAMLYAATHNGHMPHIWDEFIKAFF